MPHGIRLALARAGKQLACDILRLLLGLCTMNRSCINERRNEEFLQHQIHVLGREDRQLAGDVCGLDLEGVARAELLELLSLSDTCFVLGSRNGYPTTAPNDVDFNRICQILSDVCKHLDV